MIFEKAGIHITSVDYEIDYDSARKIVTITPVLHTNCPRRQLLIASIHVDGHELRPSLKLFLEEGEHSYKVPYVRIANPMLAEPGDESGNNEYKITLKLHFTGEEEHDLDGYIKITDKQT